MFGPGELQTLISGSPSPVNLLDLRAHTHYAGGYADQQPYIEGFWRVLESLDEEDKRRCVACTSTAVPCSGTHSLVHCTLFVDFWGL